MFYSFHDSLTTISYILSVSKPQYHCSLNTVIINIAVRTKHRSILQEPNQKGRPCPATLTQDKPCKAVPCYDWAITQWTECTTLVRHNLNLIPV